MKRIKRMLPYLSLMLCAVTALLGSCVDEDGITRTKGTGDLTLTLKLEVPKNSIPETRAMTGSDESALNSIKILVFKNDAGTEKYAYTAYVDKFTGSSVTAKLIRSTAGEQYRLVLLANVSSLPAISANETKADVLKKITFATSTKWPTTGTSRYIPMWGESGLQQIADYTNLGSVQLLRALAKVDVNCTVATSTFQLQHVYLYNTSNKAYAAPLAANVSGNVANAPSIPTGASTNGVIEYIAASNAYTNEIYLAEAAKGSENTLSTSPCMVIGGKYNSGAETFYRVDFVKTTGTTNTFLDILRNKQYNVKITGVSGAGYPTKEDAFNARAVNMSVAITDWDASGMTDIAFDGQYTLGIGKNKIDLSEFASYMEVPVSTSYEGGYTISSPDSWIIPYASTQTRTSSGKGVARIYFEANTNTAARSGVINVTAGKLKFAIPVSQEACTISMERTTNSITVLEPHSNCYLIENKNYAQKKRLLMEVGYKRESDIPVENINSVEVVWEDGVEVSNISYNSKTKRVEFTVNYPGNALIAAKDASGNILWSWHLWIPMSSTDPEDKFAAIGLSKFCYDDKMINIGMIKGTEKCEPSDVNYHMMQPLGSVAIPFNRNGNRFVFYQWGRKDPLWLIGNLSYTASSGATADNYPEYGYTHPFEVMNTEQNYIYNGESLWGGYTSVEEATLANTSMEPIPSSHKTIYDPSPFGWKVPSYKGEMYYPNYTNWGLKPGGTSNEGMLMYEYGNPAAGSIPDFRSFIIDKSSSIVGARNSYYITSMASGKQIYADLLNMSTPEIKENAATLKGGAYLVHCVRDF